MSDLLQRLLAERPYLLADGATGTNLFEAGLATGEAPEMWNFEHPERIEALHQGMVDAGADIILTNSFGGSRYRLKLHKAQDRVAEINRRAVEIARKVADRAGRPVVVAASIGPTGELFEPLGPLTHAEGVAAFAEQARAQAEAGADVLWIETMSSKDEIRAAAEGAASTGLPYVCTLSFDTNGRTMMGLMPGEHAQLCHGLHPRPLAYGANCGVGAAELVAAIVNMSGAAESSDIIVAKGDCGIPYYVDGKIRYDGTPELMADYARLARDAGARIIGGCCGTSPAHLRSMREALENHTPGPKPTLEEIVHRLGQISLGANQQASGIPAPTDAGEGRRRGRRRREGASGEGAF
ncbi:MAG TPA: betaine--homocysteine S-methyltransferase [Hypericibacter adhaerens]|uniref:betaine--homocysteine S-methyltransferase n=1 Tax=Hypericibacter adhaerens TaxID=2602016 RepID=UPI002BBA6AE5|nr:betaine--homocysteine S-methyltransferase [Hypericibacter adhaerens]HWA44468.1 betaine--homocysteine S-methyltransferase [Hypericibacter adhaerens]